MGNENKRPPLGVMPLWRHNELRLEDVSAAIERYMTANREIPQEWINEKYGLQQWLKDRTEAASSIPPPQVRGEGLYSEADIKEKFVDFLKVQTFKSQQDKEHLTNEFIAGLSRTTLPVQGEGLYNDILKAINPKGERDYGKTLAKKIYDLVATHTEQVWNAARKATVSYDNIHYEYTDFKEFISSLENKQPCD